MNAKKKCKLIDIVRSGIFYTPFYPIAVLGWLLIPVRYFDWYSYKYPVIKNGFILLTIANMVLPIIIMVLSGVFVYYQRKRLCIIMKILTIFSIIAANCLLVVELLGPTSIMSETINPKHYGKYDSCVPKEGLAYFPEKVPENAVDIQYYYGAEKESDYYIAVSWRYEKVDEMYLKEEQLDKQDLRKYEDWDFITYISSDELTKITIERNERKIYYVVCSRNYWMPNDVKDVFAMGLDEIWIGRGNVTEDIDDESAYDLAELDAFFRGRGISVPELFGGPEHALRFEEVNERFPVEIIGKGYCRYKVKQGGYYYVFWASRYRSTEKMKEVNEMVYFSAYIPSSRDVSMFESLEVGVSTAADVAAIDPSVQINVFLSHGIHTYSYLNKESLLEIEYEYIKTGNGLEDLVVKEIVVVPRDIKNAASVFCRLKNRDLPE